MMLSGSTHPYRPLVLAIFALSILQGCAIEAHDAALDQYRLAENQAPAEALALKLGKAQLHCDAVKAGVLSGKNVVGAPLGPVWRDYRIVVSGCEKSINYRIQCQGDRYCLQAKN